MKTGQKGIELIKEFEGCKLKAYQDSVGVWTIGYGHTKNVKKGDAIDQAQADQFLINDLSDAENAVNHLVKVEITQEMFDALSSFTFNLGAGKLQSSTLLKLLNDSKYSEASAQFTRWVFAGGKKLNGLVRRREAEQKLFRSAQYPQF